MSTLAGGSSRRGRKNRGETQQKMEMGEARSSRITSRGLKKRKFSSGKHLREKIERRKWNNGWKRQPVEIWHCRGKELGEVLDSAVVKKRLKHDRTNNDVHLHAGVASA